MRQASLAGLFVLTCLAPVAALAEDSSNAQVEACKATGLIALKEKTPSITDIYVDVENLSIIQADAKIEDTVVKTIILGDAYLQKGAKTGKPYKLICIIGDKGKVLMTYFTQQ
ncbi:hypothetical protein BH10PSE9_BH10PSE9_02070 [soil metagenome]